MSKRFVTIIGVFALMVGLAGTLATLKPTSASAAAQKITICHRTNSIKNPYTVNKVDADSVDGNLGNDNGKGDHYVNHVGPIADPQTMTNGDDWGDIIPPIPGVHQGLNWTEQGQAIYRNNCNIPEQEEEGEPEVTASLVCDLRTKTFTLTISNTGTALSGISLNGEDIVLLESASIERSLVDNGNGVTIELYVDGVIYGEGDNAFDGTRPFFCKQGSGSENPTTPEEETPTTPTSTTTGNGAASLPLTGGVNPIVSLVALLATVGATAGGYIWHNRANSQL